MTMASFTKSLENAGYKIGDLKSIKLSHLKKGEANHSSDRGISGRSSQLSLSARRDVRPFQVKGCRGFTAWTARFSIFLPREKN